MYEYCQLCVGAAVKEGAALTTKKRNMGLLTIVERELPKKCDK